MNEQTLKAAADPATHALRLWLSALTPTHLPRVRVSAGSAMPSPSRASPGIIATPAAA